VLDRIRRPPKHAKAGAAPGGDSPPSQLEERRLHRPSGPFASPKCGGGLIPIGYTMAVRGSRGVPVKEEDILTRRFDARQVPALVGARRLGRMVRWTVRDYRDEMRLQGTGLLGRAVETPIRDGWLPPPPLEREGGRRSAYALASRPAGFELEPAAGG